MGLSIPTVGRDAIASAAFLGEPLYLGLIIGPRSGVSFAAGDTMGAHAGWGECVAYSEATRQLWIPGSILAGALDNSASPVIVTLTANVTIAGFFLTTSATKGGTTGTLRARVLYPLDRAGLLARLFYATGQVAVT